MIATSHCRLLRHAPAPGAWNMAVDEMLLERSEAEATACLRLYAWNEPTLSLGYFQTYADRREHAASETCAAVRRLTGGGAILHDTELTYSIALPSIHPLAVHRDELYRAVHGCLIDALARLGIRAQIWAEKGKTETGRQPFLCFQRRSPGDVVVDRWKVCGSAQRRRNGAVLQHGSLLWRASPSAPELPGVADIAGPIDLETAAELWLGGMRGRLGLEWHSGELGETELGRAEGIVQSRYGRDAWTQNRGRAPDCGQEML